MVQNLEAIFERPIMWKGKRKRKMGNLNSNLGVVSSILVFLFGLFFFSVVLLHADTGHRNVNASSICPKTRNASLCRSVFKPAPTSDDAVNLANYTLTLARTRALESLSHARRLAAAATTNPLLQKRYSECSSRFNFVVVGTEEAQQALLKGGYIPLHHITAITIVDADECLHTFRHPPPEPSALPKKAKDLGDICDIAHTLCSILGGDDY